MSYCYPFGFEYDHTFTSTNQSTGTSFTYNQYSSTFSNNNNYRYNTSNHFVDTHHSNLMYPPIAEYYSHLNDSRISQPNFSYRQPITNPHTHLSTRNENNRPSHFTSTTRNTWFKSGQKANHNQRLVTTFEPFHWPESNYDPPVYIHYRTPESHIQGLIHKLSHVRLYTVDTESDKPDPQYPHSRPALIKIQAVHEQNFSTILIIEVEYLPDSSTHLFFLIKNLCRMIFTSNNKIIAWGDIIQELQNLKQFDLFDLSQIIEPVNLQNIFKSHWNTTHPHTSDCLKQHQPMVDESESDDILICLIDSDDLNNDFDSTNPFNDYNGCICPLDIRPYKVKNSIWDLEKAIQFIFNKALNKPITLPYWSSGIDTRLNPWRSNEDKHTRSLVTTYAMNHLFATTNLYFYISNLNSVAEPLPQSLQLNLITPRAADALPLFFIFGDSHTKYLPPVVNTPNYTQITKSISGLQWVNTYDNKLCTRSLVLSQPISSILSQCTHILFIVGTNSIRTTNASQAIQQLDDILDLIRSQHPHLNTKNRITVTSVIPCMKPSASFPTLSSLTFNIHQYNHLLNDLSFRKNFNTLNLPITNDQLMHDRMHIHITYLPVFYQHIERYVIDSLEQQQHVQLRQSQRRSKAAKQRRNKKRHAKLRIRQATQTVVRPIARIWKLDDVKTYLRYKNIRYARLPKIRNHQLCIQFNNTIHQQQAEQILAVHDFDAHNYYNWISSEH